MSSSTSTSTTPRGSTFKRCLVIENHNQARSTCCYPNSLKNRTISTEPSEKYNLNSQVHYKLTKNCENRTKGALVDDSENGERSNSVRKNCFSENVNRNENSYTSLLLSPSSLPSSFQRENSLIHSSDGIHSINSVIDRNAIFNHHSCNQINCDQWTQNNCNLINRENYSIHSTCNDPDLIQSNQDNVNDVWNVDSVGVSKLRTPSNLCKSNRQVPIIRKLTPKVKTKISLNEGFECNVIVEQQHKTKIAQLNVIKQNDNVKSNDGIDDNDDDSHFNLHSNSTADVGCLSSTKLCNDDLIVCDDDRANECLVKNADNRIVFVEEGKYLNGDTSNKQIYRSNNNYWNELNDRSQEFGEHNLKKAFNSEGFVKEHYRYKKISPQGNRRFANNTTTSLVFGTNRQYSGIYVSLTH